MSNDPKIDPVLEMVNSMNRARESGQTDFDSKSSVERMLVLAEELDAVLTKHALEKGLSASDILSCLMVVTVAAIAQGIKDEDPVTQTLVMAAWNSRFSLMCVEGLKKNRNGEKS